MFSFGISFLFQGVLLLFNDWAIGFTNAYLMFALAFGQLSTKVFALQWILPLLLLVF